MGIVRIDMNQIRLQSILLLPKQSNHDYYIMLFKNAKSFFYGCDRPDLVEELDFIINEKIEKIMGTKITTLLITYKNLPYLNSFTRSKNILYKNKNIYKYDMQEWLDEIEAWIFRKIPELEQNIRFQLPPKQFI